MSTGAIKGIKTKREIRRALKSSKTRESIRAEVDQTTDVSSDRTAHEQFMMDNCDTLECD